MPEIADLEQRLGRLRAELEWPATPDLATRIRERMGAPVIVLQRPWFQSRWAVAAAIVLLALAALVAYTPSPQPSGPLGKRLGLGDPTTLADVRSKVSWHVAVPASLGAPDEVYVQLPPDGPAQGEVSLVYKTRADIKTSGQTGVAVLITEANGQVKAEFFGKMLGSDATLEDVTVNGHPGYWISGKPHGFFFTDANGNFRDETFRLATNTLIFDDNGTIVRIEGGLTKAQALTIATSLS